MHAIVMSFIDGFLKGQQTIHPSKHGVKNYENGNTRIRPLEPPQGLDRQLLSDEFPIAFRHKHGNHLVFDVWDGPPLNPRHQMPLSYLKTMLEARRYTQCEEVRHEVVLDDGKPCSAPYVVYRSQEYHTEHEEQVNLPFGSGMTTPMTTM